MGVLWESSDNIFVIARGRQIYPDRRLGGKVIPGRVSKNIHTKFYKPVNWLYAEINSDKAPIACGSTLNSSIQLVYLINVRPHRTRAFAYKYRISLSLSLINLVTSVGKKRILVKQGNEETDLIPRIFLSLYHFIIYQSDHLTTKSSLQVNKLYVSSISYPIRSVGNHYLLIITF